METKNKESWIRNNKRKKFISFENKELLQAITVDKKSLGTVGFVVELYTREPFKRTHFKWFNTFEKAMEFAKEYMETEKWKQ